MSSVNYSKQKVRSIQETLTYDVRRLNQTVNQSQFWWQGIAGDAFREEWEDVNRVSIQLERQMDHIQGALNSLESTIQRADRERIERLQLEKLQRERLQRERQQRLEVVSR